MRPDPTGSAGSRPRLAAPGDAKKKKQLALVAFLLTVLLIALVCSPSDNLPTDDATSVKTSLVSLKPLAQRTPDADRDDLMERFVTAADLPTLSPEEINATDLFRSPAIEVVQDVPDQAPRQTETPATVEYTLGAVYGAYEGTDRKALIDGQIVQSGEKLETGVVVIQVSDEGVEVAP